MYSKKIFILIYIFILPIRIFSKNNLDTTSGCYVCHQELKNNFQLEVIHSPVSEGDCESCHINHEKTNKLILKEPKSELCYQCHQNDDEKFEKAHQGNFIPKDSCINCHSPHASNDIHLIYSNQHTPFKNRKCTDCHLENADSTNLKIGITKLCRTCHDDQKKENQNNKTKSKETKINYHLPYLVGLCTSCHNPHASKNANQLKIVEGDMCIEKCHVLLTKEKNIHEPVSKKECLTCHDPHKSPNENLLKIKSNKKMSSISELCQGCHKNTVTGKNVHMVVLAGDCDMCHQNHSAPNKKLLKQIDQILCYSSSCHESVEKNINVHEPVSEGKCISCHDPHSSNNRKLLKSTDSMPIVNIAKLCFVCHKKFEFKPGNHKPVAQGLCDSCHETHSSDNPKLLKKQTVKLCLGCHPNKDKSEIHNIDKVCTECHDPHSPRQN